MYTLYNKNRYSWNEIKRIWRSAGSFSSVVDCFRCINNIADQFSTIYRDLYTWISFHSDKMADIWQDNSDS